MANLFRGKRSLSAAAAAAIRYDLVSSDVNCVNPLPPLVDKGLINSARVRFSSPYSMITAVPLAETISIPFSLPIIS